MQDELFDPPINHETTKHAQIELIPFVDKYDLPLSFVITIASLIALKQLGLIGIVKDIWSGAKGIFNQKNTQIFQLKTELNEVRHELDTLQEKYQDMAIRYNSVTSVMRGMRPHLKSLGMDLDEFDKIFNP